MQLVKIASFSLGLSPFAPLPLEADLNPRFLGPADLLLDAGAGAGAEPAPAPAPSPAPDAGGTDDTGAPQEGDVYWNPGEMDYPRPAQRPVEDIFVVNAPAPAPESNALPKFLVPAIGIGLAGLIVGYMLSKD